MCALEHTTPGTWCAVHPHLSSDLPASPVRPTCVMHRRLHPVSRDVTESREGGWGLCACRKSVVVSNPLHFPSPHAPPNSAHSLAKGDAVRCTLGGKLHRKRGPFLHDCERRAPQLRLRDPPLSSLSSSTIPRVSAASRSEAVSSRSGARHRQHRGLPQAARPLHRRRLDSSGQCTASGQAEAATTSGVGARTSSRVATVRLRPLPTAAAGVMGTCILHVMQIKRVSVSSSSVVQP